MCENYLSHCSGAAALLVEGAALVLAFTPLGWVVPVHLLIAHVPERSSKPGRAGSSGPVAQPAVPVEADVHVFSLVAGFVNLLGAFFLVSWDCGRARKNALQKLRISPAVMKDSLFLQRDEFSFVM